ncbi:hypothetical protein EVAR_57955_1 [Eumeta japonica]|uniref:Uncharacterized protein n=1 Tax=Eumeta variegata TaxID=151549 RepID=A0A4C1XZJ2_EUMVA|nr:hypothetical protein EVAR_57955_1 [Eumeta japonica]
MVSRSLTSIGVKTQTIPATALSRATENGVFFDRPTRTVGTAQKKTSFHVIFAVKIIMIYPNADARVLYGRERAAMCLFMAFGRWLRAVALWSFVNPHYKG